MTAPTLRGTSSGTATGGAPVTVNMPVGTAQGDVCLLMVMSNSLADRVFTEQSSTWTKLLDLYANGTSEDCNVALFRKVQGPTPDTSVTVQIDAGSSGIAAILRVYEDADPDSPEDVTVVSATATGAADPDPGAITPITPDALVIAWAAVSDADVVTNPPTGYVNVQNLIHQSNISLMAAEKVVATPAAEDPGAFADVALGGAGDSKVVITYALRPAPEVVPAQPAFSLLGVMRGAPLVAPPPETFIMFDEFRYGDISNLGFVNLLVIYESAMAAPGDARTDPPDPVFLNDVFAELRSNNPNTDRICLDYEAWGPPGTDAQARQNFVTLLTACKNHFPDAGFYGEIPERYTLYLNFPPGDPTFESRRAGWFQRAAAMQAMWDIADTIYPSLYYIAPVATNADDRDMWYADNLAMANQFAPNKKVFPFLWPRIHQSVDPNMPDVPGPYWRASLESLRALGYPGFAGWAQAGDTDPRIRNPIPAFWLEMEAFAATV